MRFLEEQHGEPQVRITRRDQSATRTISPRGAGRRRAWPESIKSRALELRSQGLNFRQISHGTKLPYFTVLKWHHERKAPSFDLVNVVPTRGKLAKPGCKVATVTDATRGEGVGTRSELALDSSSTVTVTLPTGIRIEGVSLTFLLGLLPKLGMGVK